jgi:hypothetical protein
VIFFYNEKERGKKEQNAQFLIRQKLSARKLTNEEKNFFQKRKKHKMDNLRKKRRQRNKLASGGTGQTCLRP